MQFPSLIDRAYAISVTPVGTADVSGSGNATALVDNATTNIVNLLFLIGGALAVIYLLWAGIQYISAGGSPDKAKAGRQGIINAVIGIIIMMAAWFIIRVAVSVGTDASKLDKAGTVNTPKK